MASKDGRKGILLRKCGGIADGEKDAEGPEGHVYIGVLDWWTTDADLETECKRFGRVTEIKFFEDNVNGKSKGAAKVTFTSQRAAATCQAEMNGCAHCPTCTARSTIKRLAAEMHPVQALIDLICPGMLSTERSAL